MKKQYLPLAGAIVFTVLGSLYFSSVARADLTQAIRFLRESPQGQQPPGNGTAYSTTLSGTVVSGRLEKLLIGSKEQNGHTYTGIIIGVRSDRGNIRLGHGVSHFVVPAGVVIPPSLIEPARIKQQ